MKNKIAFKIKTGYYLKLLISEMMMIMMMNCFVVWLTDKRRSALFQAGTSVRDSHHHKSLTRHEQSLNLCGT